MRVPSWVERRYSRAGEADIGKRRELLELPDRLAPNLVRGPLGEVEIRRRIGVEVSGKCFSEHMVADEILSVPSYEL